MKILSTSCILGFNLALISLSSLHAQMPGSAPADGNATAATHAPMAIGLALKV